LVVVAVGVVVQLAAVQDAEVVVEHTSGNGGGDGLRIDVVAVRDLGDRAEAGAGSGASGRSRRWRVDAASVRHTRFTGRGAVLADSGLLDWW
jgi:hypothetical protein